MVGEVEPVASGSSEAKPMASRSSEAEPALDELMLMTISLFSSGTLVLVPDSSPRACGGVEYSFKRFLNGRTLGALAFFCRPQHDLGMVIPFRQDRTPWVYSCEV